MAEVSFIQVNHLHCDNSLHLRDFRVVRFDDLPAGLREAGQAERRQRVAEALGVADLDRVEPIAQRAFGTILGSMIHDIANLSGFFGPPTRVVGTELWANGRGINTVIEYPHDRRAICSWVDLPELWEFTETFEVYGSRDRVRVAFPSGFARGMMSTVNVHGMEPDGRPWRKELVFHDNPFRLELLHFRQCVLEGKQPITPGREAVADIKLVADIVRAYLDGHR
jgi:predicted dehydrogenase